MLLLLDIIGGSLAAAPLLVMLHDIIIDAPAARATALGIALTILAIAIGAHYYV